jgi:hypothetical protein
MVIRSQAQVSGGCGRITADETIETIDDITRKNFAAKPTISNANRSSF